MGNFFKHYIAPLLKRGQTVPYDARTFFDSWYSSQQELTDAATISKLATPTFTRYHYNATESSLIEFFARRNPPRAPTVLDVGCGSGHWIRFYRDVFGARPVVGVDISDAGITALREHLKGLDATELLRADVSSADFRLDETFDIINAVGVMFHIVDDEAWRRAVENQPGASSRAGRCHRGRGAVRVDHAKRAVSPHRRVRGLVSAKDRARHCASTSGSDRSGRGGTALREPGWRSSTSYEPEFRDRSERPKTTSWCSGADITDRAGAPGSRRPSTT